MLGFRRDQTYSLTKYFMEVFFTTKFGCANVFLEKYDKSIIINSQVLTSSAI